MDRSSDRSTSSVGRTLDKEMDLVEEAIAMVADGGAPRIVLGGLQFGEALLTSAGRMASEAGVRLVPLWMPDDVGADIAVERIADD